MNFETDINARERLLHDACMRGWDAHVTVLLEAGADANHQDMDGKTALMLAAQFGGAHGAEMMRLLVDAGADANKQGKYGRTALMKAAEHGGEHAEPMMRLLVDAGADVHKQGMGGETALMVAARWGGEHGAGMMRLLLDAGADANKQGKYGWTALMLAARWGGEHGAGMMRLLVEYGATAPERLEHASPELTEYIDGTRNWTPLHRAADARDAKKLHKLLCEGTTRPNEAVESPHPHMRTALEIAKSSSYPTAQPVCKECLALLQPSLVKSVVPSDKGGGGGGGGGSLFATE